MTIAKSSRSSGIAGAVPTPKSPWSKSARETILAQAITLAGIHEAVYLALSDRMRRLFPAPSST